MIPTSPPAPDTPPRVVLHVLTRPGDSLAAKAINRAQSSAEGTPTVRTFDLTIPNPDYDALLAAVFAADAVAVWS